MKSAKVTAFLSCSFSKDDETIVTHFASICRGLDIECVNVSTASNALPPDKAREMIHESQIFIAIATRRTKLPDGEHVMPEAVHDEIAIAYALKKPLLVLREDGVLFKGFLNSYSTHLTFKRDSLSESQALEKTVQSIHSHKMSALSSHDLVPEQDSRGFYAEYLHALYELKHDGKEFFWHYSTTRKLHFTEPFNSTIKSSAWATLVAEDADPNSRIEHTEELESGSKPFKLLVSIERNDWQCVETALRISPAPERGDFVTLTHTYKSKYLNRIFRGSSEPPMSAVGDKQFSCMDGFVPTFPIKHLELHVRFPKAYQLKKEDMFPFVGSYSAGIDYIVESEMKRAQVGLQSIGGEIMYSIKAESPLLRHVYGLAWNIPQTLV